MNNVWLAFVTGLTTGGVSCLAVQGGLLASSITHGQEEELIQKSKRWQMVAAFLSSKVFAYTILGAGLGLAGSALTLSPKLLGWMQIFAGIFMLVTAARLLDLHPIFRYFVIQPPRWAFRLMKNQSTSSSFFAPILLGFLTILIPCGITQAMMVLAIATGSPLYGALIMLAFTLGTSPVFFALGVATVELVKRKAFSFAASAVILSLGLLSINTGQVLRGSNHTLQNYIKVISGGVKTIGKSAQVNAEGKQEATVTITASGYTTSASTLKAGVPTKLNLISKNAQGCVRAFTIPSLNISKVLPINGSDTLEFTPTNPGKLAFTCSMGMYTGEFTVIQ